MIKDITLGQFFPGNSIVHRLDPRTKILLTILYIVALFCAKNYVSYAFMLLVLITCVRLSTIRVKSLVRGIKPLIIIIVFTAILNMFFTNGTPVADVWLIRRITWEGLRTALFMVLRIMMLVSGTFLLTYTTSPMALTDGLEQLLNPLKKIRVPVHELAMMMSIALRFIPTLIEETDKIMSAQKARGADFETGTSSSAPGHDPPAGTAFRQAFRRADELATAMESRCYHGGEGRTRLKQLHLVRRDYMALLLGLLVIACVILLARFGV
jgi:energy-coupling factor transport system permease protein